MRSVLWTSEIPEEVWAVIAEYLGRVCKCIDVLPDLFRDPAIVANATWRSDGRNLHRDFVTMVQEMEVDIRLCFQGVKDVHRFDEILLMTYVSPEYVIGKLRIRANSDIEQYPDGIRDLVAGIVVPTGKIQPPPIITWGDIVAVLTSLEPYLQAAEALAVKEV